MIAPKLNSSSGSGFKVLGFGIMVWGLGLFGPFQQSATNTISLDIHGRGFPLGHGEAVRSSLRHLHLRQWAATETTTLNPKPSTLP